MGYGKGSSRFSLNKIGDLDLFSVEGLDQDATRQERDSDFFSFAAGLRWDAFRSAHTQLALKLAGSTTSFLDTESQQGRLAAEVAREFPFSSGVLSSSLDLAVLLDRDNSSDMEVAAGLDWAAANDQFTASTVARTLLFSGDRYQWGLGAALNYQAGVRPGRALPLPDALLRRHRLSPDGVGYSLHPGGCRPGLPPMAAQCPAERSARLRHPHRQRASAPLHPTQHGPQQHHLQRWPPLPTG
ncbi:MAG: autotransporter outer membrane beta-barrel domain-containing protein [Synechococcus sp. SB0665_bin_28]|nr:autotransporter outer membrane beta-barrel domain-containing protein [Synechococcus sp. SB0665_bin_28]